METVFFHGFRLAGVLVDFWDARSARLWAFGRGAMQDFRVE